MRRQGGGGFGFLLLVIVALIVFLLTAKSWKNAGAAAVGVTKPMTPEAQAKADLDVSNSTLTQPVSNIPSNGINSRLTDMKAKTDAHIKAVQDASGQTAQ